MKSALHPILRQAIKKLDIDATSLEEAATWSEEHLEQIRKDLRGAIPKARAEGLDVVVCGSLARREATAISDLDAVVAIHRLPSNINITRRLLQALYTAQEAQNIKNPGKTGMFGGVVSVADIVERIGLDQDTNLNHSRRILFLLESESLFNPRQHDRLIRILINRYLADYSSPKDGVPRFLLNDFMKYWRTLTIDYQAKRWEGGPADWGMRYLKLVISRKLTYVSAVVSILLTKKAETNYFIEQFKMPALARIAQLHRLLDRKRLKDLKTVLEVANYFVGKLSSTKFREEAVAVQSQEQIEPGSEFAQARNKAKKLQGALENIFFESRLLRDRSIRYLSF